MALLEVSVLIPALEGERMFAFLGRHCVLLLILPPTGRSNRLPPTGRRSRHRIRRQQSRSQCRESVQHELVHENPTASPSVHVEHHQERGHGRLPLFPYFVTNESASFHLQLEKTCANTANR